MEQALRLAKGLTQTKESVLKRAFEAFTEASSRLESRFQELQKETETLRAKLKEKEEEIKRAEKLATLGETAAALAHEVRNPLGAIKLFLSLLRRDLAEKPESLDLVNKIDQSVGNLDSVVSNILQFSKEERFDLAPVNIHSIVNELKEHFAASQANAAKFEIALNGNPYVMGSECALRRTLYNLMLNALQATKFRGTITIACNDGQNDKLLLQVADDGPGIEAEILEKLFDPFVSSRKEGTGLGLAIVRQSIEKHGGTIKASNQAKGALFSIELPRKLGNL